MPKTTALDLRPTEWADYIGQEKLKARLEIHIQAALERNEPLDHIFLAAPPGSGKTTLASLIAHRLRTGGPKPVNCDFLGRVAPIKPALFRSIVRDFRGVLLIDEIHRMSAGDQESLLTLLTDGILETDFGGIENKRLTIVGATTEKGKVILPLRDRFPIMPHFEPYSDAEMALIVQAMGRRLHLKISAKNALALALATNGVPRAAEQFVVAARDLKTTTASTILEFLKYTEDGLSIEHREYLELLCKNEMMGLDAILTHLEQPRAVIKEMERVLLNKGLLAYSKTGRIATPAAHKLMKGNS